MHKITLSKINNKKLLFIISGLFLLSAGLIAAYFLLGSGNKISKDEVSQISKYSDCSEGLSKLEGKKPGKNEQDRLTYMFYRASCLTNVKRYSDARQQYNELIDFYSKKNDQSMIDIVKQQLQEIDELEKNDGGKPYEKAKLRTSPEGIYL